MRFIITSPIVAEMCMEYEDTFGPWPINLDEHHECYSAFQMNFFEDVKRLLDCFESSLNPFSSLCPTALCFVHNGNTIPMKILQSHYDRYSLKVSSYTKIIQTRLEECSVSIPATISQNKLLLPSNNAQVETDAKFKFVIQVWKKVFSRL